MSLTRNADRKHLKKMAVMTAIFFRFSTVHLKNRTLITQKNADKKSAKSAFFCVPHGFCSVENFLLMGKYLREKQLCPFLFWGFEYLLGCAAFHDLPLVEEEHAVCDGAGEAHLVSHHENRHA